MSDLHRFDVVKNRRLPHQLLALLRDFGHQRTVHHDVPLQLPLLRISLHQPRLQFIHQQSCLSLDDFDALTDDLAR